MEETLPEQNKHKVLVGFKCSPSLRAMLCSQADKLEVTLSSYVETIVLTREHDRKEISILSKQAKTLKETIAFYENPIMKELYEEYKGKSIAFKDRTGKTVNLTINSIQDVFTIIINSFKTTK